MLQTLVHKRVGQGVGIYCRKKLRSLQVIHGEIRVNVEGAVRLAFSFRHHYSRTFMGHRGESQSNALVMFKNACRTQLRKHSHMFVT